MTRAAWSVIGSLWLLALAGCGDDQGPTFTREQLLDPETCKDCHPKHYEEWSASMHAYATRDPVFLAMNKRGQEEAQIGDFCVKCHAPMALRENAIKDFGDLTNLPKHLQGVTCYFCHNAVNVKEPHNNANIDLANDTIMRGALGNPIETPAHGVLDGKSKFHDRYTADASALCGACHDIRTPSGFDLERTFSEYKLSVQSTAPLPDFLSCVTCHMKVKRSKESAAPGFTGQTTQRDVHWHMFPAVDVALTPDLPHQDAMLAAVEDCELQVRTLNIFKVRIGENWLPGEPFNFVLEIEHLAGHNIPSGATADRRMWVEVVVYDDKDQIIMESGRIADGELEEKPKDDPKHDPQLRMFRDYLLDKDGKETHMFWEGASFGPDSNLMPYAVTAVSGSHTAIRTFSTTRAMIKPPPKIELWLRLRPMGVDVLQDLVKSGHLDPAIIAKMPTHMVTHAIATLKADGRSYEMSHPPGFDPGPDSCKKFEKLMDDAAAN